MKRIINKVLCALLALVFLGCDHIDNKALPNYQVRINLGTYALWSTYGVSGVGDYVIFNRERHLPSNFPYNANTYTGFGGVILIMGLDSSTGSYAPLAFDASCPVESRSDVMLSVSSQNFEAVCPQCGSHYNLLTGAGGPVSGTATDRKVGLRAYKVHASVNGGYIITNY